MKKCDQCGAMILFGPVREGSQQYCSYNCRDVGLDGIAAVELPRDFIIEKAQEVYSGNCPKCGGEGPIDVHVSHKVWSLVAISSFKSVPSICCNRCGRKLRHKAMAFCALFGWWGFPWGIFGTPAQIFKNFRSSNYGANEEPSPELIEMVRIDLAKQFAKSSS